MLLLCMQFAVTKMELEFLSIAADPNELRHCAADGIFLLRTTQTLLQLQWRPTNWQKNGLPRATPFRLVLLGRLSKGLAESGGAPLLCFFGDFVREELRPTAVLALLRE